MNIMKSFVKPPALVQFVMDSVCLLFGQKEEWDSSKKLLGQMTFLDELKSFDFDKVPE